MAVTVGIGVLVLPPFSGLTVRIGVACPEAVGIPTGVAVPEGVGALVTSGRSVVSGGIVAQPEELGAGVAEVFVATVVGFVTGGVVAD